MNALTQLERIDDMLPAAFGDSLRRFLRSADWPALHTPSDMRVDITEHDDVYEVRAEIPGAKKDDIKVAVDGNRVLIEAEVKEQKESRGNGGRSLVREIYRGQMSRAFTLACGVDEARIDAKFEDGILSMSLPKRFDTKQKLVKIN